jgi:hypothetical protein
VGQEEDREFVSFITLDGFGVVEGAAIAQMERPKVDGAASQHQRFERRAERLLKSSSSETCTLSAC